MNVKREVQVGQTRWEYERNKTALYHNAKRIRPLSDEIPINYEYRIYLTSSKL